MSRFAELADLNGRWMLVTGATGHVGVAACRTLRELGANLILVDRDSSACEALAEELGSSVGQSCDLTNLDDVRRLASWANERGPLDSLVHCAAFVGTSQLPGWAVPIPDQSPDIWGDVLNVNVSSLFVLAQMLRGRLSESGRGTIVAVSSIYGHFGPDMGLYEGTNMANPVGYGVTKGGLGQLVRYLATTYAPEIRTNAISPGGIFRGQDPKFVDRYAKRTPLGRMACEDDMVGAIAFLVSDLSRYVNGQDLLIDGGWSAW